MIVLFKHVWFVVIASTILGCSTSKNTGKLSLKQGNAAWTANGVTLTVYVYEDKKRKSNVEVIFTLRCPHENPVEFDSVQSETDGRARATRKIAGIGRQEDLAGCRVDVSVDGKEGFTYEAKAAASDSDPTDPDDPPPAPPTNPPTPPKTYNMGEVLTLKWQDGEDMQQTCAAIGHMYGVADGTPIHFSDKDYPDLAKAGSGKFLVLPHTENKDCTLAGETIKYVAEAYQTGLTSNQCTPNTCWRRANAGNAICAYDPTSNSPNNQDGYWIRKTSDGKFVYHLVDIPGRAGTPCS